ncbi:MAG TPA: deoxyribonuclease II family protein [Steroidobacteraceae bacterium]|jgi:hypothetical protein|nr:deoxyribonuclease II family protein [Steroidobacteraceae bacterium]
MDWLHDHTIRRPRFSAAPWIAALVLVLAAAARAEGPTPLVAADKPVKWWFVFKLNAGKFPKCAAAAVRACPFGGDVQPYTSFGQQYVYTSDADPDTVAKRPELEAGGGCVGDTAEDPVGATFAEIYRGNFHYVVWNDQFYQEPSLPSCSSDSCPSPWGHSKGLLVWDDSGSGLIMQVTTPSWPGAGSAGHPRTHDDNTLGCVTINDVKFSQHFFALAVNHADLLIVLRALGNASVATDPADQQIVSNGGPADVAALVSALGKKSKNAQASIDDLSSGVRLISKPSALHVPPWQLVSSLLQGTPLRTATWWMRPEIPTTSAQVKCWDSSLTHNPGRVEIATSGTWNGTIFSLKAGPAANGNHAKIGVSTDGTNLAIFGDMNQQGAISGNAKACGVSQNGRGGLFFVVHDESLAARVASLLHGDTAP